MIKKLLHFLQRLSGNPFLRPLCTTKIQTLTTDRGQSVPD